MIDQSRDVKLVIAGHVDHGKSTLVGHLMHAANALPEGKLDAVRAACDKRGIAFEWAFVMDALKEERAQGITLDAAHIVLNYKNRRFILVDAPGHHELLKNFITAAESADGAIVVIDAKEGLCEQTRRHLTLLQMMGVSRLLVAVNKMDRVEYHEDSFRDIARKIESYAASLGFSVMAVIPICARGGDHLIAVSPHMPWYQGESLMAAMERFAAEKSSPAALRFVVQDVVKHGDKRLILGRVLSGVLRQNQTVLFLPGERCAVVAGFESWPPDGTLSSAEAGHTAAITLDRAILVERGMVACDEAHAAKVGNRFRARLFWLGTSPLEAGKIYHFTIAAASSLGEITAIERLFDPQSLTIKPAPARLSQGEIGDVVIRLRRLLALDDAPLALGHVVIREHGQIVGGALLSLDGFADLRLNHAAPKSTHLSPVECSISEQERAHRNGHSGAVIWLTGLSSSGKSTIAHALARRLFDLGYQVGVLDGDRLRLGLSRDLGFDLADRRENIRRAGEVAALMAGTGMIVLAAFISPTKEDRDQARASAPEIFHLVRVRASLETCEARDVKGLYAKARRGEIKDFTGISAPYEEPQDAELTIDTQSQTVENAVEVLERYIEKQCGKP